MPNTLRLFVCCLLALACATAGAFESAEMNERRAVIDEVKQLIRSGDFQALEQTYQRYNDTTQRTSSGAFKMQLFDDAVAEALSNDGQADEAYYQELEKITLAAARQHPASVLAQLLHARALGAHASHIRGGGYTNTIAEPVLQAYLEQAKRSADYMQSIYPIARNDSGWYVSMIGITRMLGGSTDQMLEYTAAGLEKNPRDFRLLQNMLISLLPKWGGSVDEVDNFINWAAKTGSQDQGLELYARLYSSAAQDQFYHRLYSDSKIDWKKMHQGLEAWSSHFPTTWNKNIYAYHACMAGDKPTTARLLRDLGDQTEAELWSPNGDVTMAACISWANK